ncbi:hypothetical protein [Prolixibacter denitrificans]|uniref:DUF4177 domain-containing protein n=1 Tax=Prolixibacter denitrificans TaxID=1541063 RepID=A0A2P8C841_9BACT|nr:hypothetical protein [Prolixibacter denitrificans]PSK81138.1 hypothetical protein CLV93_111115 [Prolixibacter denitrificans]GET22255.1 hypothetical protein JCM18694_25010 [Prolixibacter denitrificans]
MKKLLFTSLLFILFSLAATAQDKNKADSTTKFIYCELTNTDKSVGTMTTVEADFGQRKGGFHDSRLKDPKSGKVITFNSIIDALNYMGNQGWELVQTYQTSVDNQMIHHWIMKKRIE